MALSTSITLTVSDYDMKMSRSLKFYKNDALKLIFTINYWGIDNANGIPQKVLMPLEALSAVLFMETPDGTDSVEAGAVEGNVVTFYLNSEYTQNVGVSRMQIRLFDDDGCAITLPEFPFEIKENIYGGTDVNFKNVVLMDNNGNAIITEDFNQIDVGDVFLYGVEPIESVLYKEISDLELVENLDGNEDLIIQLSDGSTKRTKASEFLSAEVDLTGYATETYVQTKIAEASLSGGSGEIDLSGYVTEDELNLSLATKANKSELHTHANKTVLDGITSNKVTEWNNKSNFDGNYNSLTNKPTIPTVDVNKNYVDTQLATKANKSEIPSLNGYATETYVQNKIAEASLSGGEVDLSGYATKDDLNTKADKSAIPTKVSQLTNDKGYLTSHQDISGKADKSYVDTELAKKSNASHTHSYNDLTDKPTIPSTSNLATKTELTNGLATKADKVHTHDQYLTEHQDLSDYALKTEIPTVPTKVSQLTNDKGYLTSVPSEYITETELTDKSYATKKELTDILTTKSDTTHNHDTIYSKLNHTHSQYLTSVPSEYVTETELNDAISGLGSVTGNVSSDIIKSIMVVDALPEVEVEGVLYLVRGGTSTDTPTTPEEPTVTNLYPNQTKATTSDGFTITFTGRNVTINGRNDTKSIQCQTNQFAMALEANKTYYLKLTNVSGLFDDSKRVSQSDGMICMVALTVYDSSGTSKNLINWDERDARGIYEKFTFTPSSACVTGKLIIQAKKLTSFSNWTCSIVIAEEGV